jgi:hypothetical protein
MDDERITFRSCSALIASSPLTAYSVLRMFGFRLSARNSFEYPLTIIECLNCVANRSIKLKGEMKGRFKGELKGRFKGD